MMTAGNRRRTHAVAIALIVFAAFMHLVAYSMVGRFAEIGPASDKAALVVMTGVLLLSWSLMLSQAMESVTRAFYARSDLDLILSSPARREGVFCPVRIGTMALSITLMIAMLLAAPFINVLAAGRRYRLCPMASSAPWALSAATFGVMLTVAMFGMIGPKRTRLVAQIAAAVIGAAFVIALQLGAILYSTLSPRHSAIRDVCRARAGCRELDLLAGARRARRSAALVNVLAINISDHVGMLFAPRFAEYAAAAATRSKAVTHERRSPGGFRALTPKRALRQKEWTLLRRDPWLASQTLMQILYLLPPAVLLSRSFDDGAGALLVAVPVLVMAAGQLAGGLA